MKTLVRYEGGGGVRGRCEGEMRGGGVKGRCEGEGELHQMCISAALQILEGANLRGGLCTCRDCYFKIRLLLGKDVQNTEKQTTACRVSGVCVCVCVWVCMWVCVYVCMYVCVYVCMYVCVCMYSLVPRPY